MKNYITQYKALFYLTWISLYLIFPSWISLHSVILDRGFPDIDYSLARSLVILGMLIYFSISAYLMNRYFNTLIVDKLFIIKIKDWPKHIKSNLWIVIVCCLSVLLHIYPLSFVLVTVGGGEVPYIHQPLQIYDSLNSYWYSLFDIPVQYLFWSIIALLILLTKQKKIIDFTSNYISKWISLYKTNNLVKLFYVIIMFSLFSLYSYLYPYYTWNESLQLLRYPPVSKILYLINYYAFGISYIGPRIVQLILYILSAVYLYRTIYLFREKEAAVLGATIYLFLPIIFSYSSRAALASGTLFFIIIISYYFLKFVRYEDDRALLLTTYFIGIGFLYKRVVLIMFIICFAYLLLNIIKKRDWRSLNHFKILLLSLVPILPWLKIGSTNTAYEIAWSQLITLNSLIAVPSMIGSQISWFIFMLLMVSIIFTLIARRDHLSLFFGLLFIAYYGFFTLKGGVEHNHRYLTALYPAIAVYLALLVFAFTQRIRWKYCFILVFTILTTYLIIICTIPRTSSHIITYKYKDFEGQHYPVDIATDWISGNTGKEEKVLSLFMGNYVFYVNRMYKGIDSINIDRLIFIDFNIAKELISPMQRFEEFCQKENVSYIMIPFSPLNSFPPNASDRELMLRFKERMDIEFKEVEEFSFEDNYIFIYKIKESSNPFKTLTIAE